jgi:hypothetical protein
MFFFEIQSLFVINVLNKYYLVEKKIPSQSCILTIFVQIVVQLLSHWFALCIAL